MVFVTADRCRAQLERLTQLLVSVFPGSTVYQHTEVLRASHDVLNNKVDAVFLAAQEDKNSDLQLIERLHRQKPGLPVFVTAASDALRQVAQEAGADGYFVLPGSEAQITEAIRREKAEKAAYHK